MSTMYMETVSLNDDAPVTSSTSSSSTFLDVDTLEAQFASSSTQDEAASLETIVPVSDSNGTGNSQNEDGIMESRTSQINKQNVDDSVVVDVNTGHKDSNGFSSQNNGKKHHVLPPLRILTQHLAVEERDYVDTTLFSPDVSRHAMEVAHRRAKALATEVKEMIDLEVHVDGTTNATTKMSPAEAMGIIGGAFANSLQRAKKFVKPGTKEYDLLSGTSPLGRTSKLDDLDTDGDGLQLSPDAIHSDGKHFREKLKPALKRISAYSSAAALEPEKTWNTRPQKKKSILWHEDVLDADEEFYEDNTDGQETCSLMKPNEGAVGNGNGSPRSQLLNYNSKTNGQLTPRSRKKRKKKLLRSMMRRLTPREKEELYRQRPDLMIVPNWAQKYREEITGEDSTRWNAWLLGLIMVLAVLLLVFLLLVVRQRAVAVTS
ncbi:unnamed protein product [Peronospora farinosa]|uniref:Uncharacterized protein n=1 Tax=Peronospora farinosa TaxID=134698 RepID=A0AAV0TSR6_9STRA|nr:unnamed protein product [Peronospora farinosa]CAI5726855.1 unnamed protein product [Peronospora farinosa]